MDGENDLAQWVTTCNIDLFEQHITLRFPLVRLMNRLLIWCLLIKNWDQCQALLRFDACSSFWTHHDTCICNAVPLWCTDCKHLEPLTSCQCGVVAVVYHLVAILSCKMERMRQGRTSTGKVGTLSVIWHQTEPLSGFMVNHNAASQCR